MNLRAPKDIASKDQNLQQSQNTQSFIGMLATKKHKHHQYRRGSNSSQKSSARKVNSSI